MTGETGAGPIRVRQSSTHGNDGMWRNLGKALALVRAVRQMTQQDVATEAGIGKGQLSKYEHGKENPKLESLERLLRVLGVSPADFFYTLEIVDGRADAITGLQGRSVDLRSVARGSSLLEVGTTQVFGSVLSEVLKLCEVCVQQALRPDSLQQVERSSRQRPAALVERQRGRRRRSRSSGRNGS